MRIKTHNTKSGAEALDKKSRPMTRLNSRKNVQPAQSIDDKENIHLQVR